jgi:hypothetical protein
MVARPLSRARERVKSRRRKARRSCFDIPDDIGLTLSKGGPRVAISGGATQDVHFSGRADERLKGLEPVTAEEDRAGARVAFRPASRE